MQQFEWADRAADALRVAMRHLLELARSKTAYLAPELRDLVSKVHLEAGSQPSTPAATQPSTPATGTRARRGLTRQASTGSGGSSVVQLCGVHCQRSRCKLAASPLVIDDSPTADRVSPSVARSETSLAAEGSTTAVVSQRGGHKRQVQGLLDAERDAEKPAKRGRAVKPPSSAAASSSQPAARPANISVMHRDIPPERRRAYVMADNEFVCTFKEKSSAAYVQLAEQMAEELRTGVTLVAAAQKRKKEMIKRAKRK